MARRRRYGWDGQAYLAEHPLDLQKDGLEKKG